MSKGRVLGRRERPCILQQRCTTDELMNCTAEMAASASTRGGISGEQHEESFDAAPSLRGRDQAPPPTECFGRNSTEDLMRCTAEMAAASEEERSSVWPNENPEPLRHSRGVPDSPPPSKCFKRNSTDELMTCTPETTAKFESDDTNNETFHSSFAESFFRGSGGTSSTYTKVTSNRGGGGHCWSDSRSKGMMSSADIMDDAVPPPTELRRAIKYSRRSRPRHDEQQDQQRRAAKTRRREEWLDDFISFCVQDSDDDDTDMEDLLLQENERERTHYSHGVIFSCSNDECDLFEDPEVCEQYRIMGLNYAYERVRQNLGYHPDEELRQKLGCEPHEGAAASGRERNQVPSEKLPSCVTRTRIPQPREGKSFPPPDLVAPPPLASFYPRWPDLEEDNLPEEMPEWVTSSAATNEVLPEAIVESMMVRGGDDDKSCRQLELEDQEEARRWLMFDMRTPPSRRYVHKSPDDIYRMTLRHTMYDILEMV